MKKSFDYLHIFAHPDDDAIFGGVYQKKYSFLNWGIVCLTYNGKHKRGRELIYWQKNFNVDINSIFFLDFSDNPLDLYNNECSFSRNELVDALKNLDVTSRCILTHNDKGEYGHPHHILLNECVKIVYPNKIIIKYGFGISSPSVRLRVPSLYDIALKSYKSQAEIIHYYNRHFNSFAESNYIIY